MAKIGHTEKYTKAVINEDDRTITEILKDTTNVYSIDELLARWNNIENVSISISTDDEILSKE